ncbi:anthranilate/aminodeoxychorismate synthase component II [Halobacteriales archaeon QS_3_64_16]|nr:MAG: anthranilate/aminodeoxychorismate synthase component II [Halobacteriales archaeon QS_3_64_16]
MNTDSLPENGIEGENGSGRTSSVPHVLFVDNFDSFTYNLIEYVEEALRARHRAEVADDINATEGKGDFATGDGRDDRGPEIESTVLRNTASLADVRQVDPDAIVISPGPGHPANERDVGVTLEVLREVSPRVPTLGVCLGLEAAAYAYGGEVSRAPAPIHGKATPIDHNGKGVFAGLEEGFPAGRYHSLIASAVPDCFAVTATVEEDGETLAMGIHHREYPIECVQFHPESVLTGVGHDLIGNFLAGLE